MRHNLAERPLRVGLYASLPEPPLDPDQAGLASRPFGDDPSRLYGTPPGNPFGSGGIISGLSESPIDVSAELEN